MAEFLRGSLRVIQAVGSGRRFYGSSQYLPGLEVVAALLDPLLSAFAEPRLDGNDSIVDTVLTSSNLSGVPSVQLVSSLEKFPIFVPVGASPKDSIQAEW